MRRACVKFDLCSVHRIRPQRLALKVQCASLSYPQVVAIARVLRHAWAEGGGRREWRAARAVQRVFTHVPNY